MLRCLAIYRIALQEHLDSHVQKTLKMAHMPVDSTSEDQAGGGLAAALCGYQAG